MSLVFVQLLFPLLFVGHAETPQVCVANLSAGVPDPDAVVVDWRARKIWFSLPLGATLGAPMQRKFPAFLPDLSIDPYARPVTKTRWSDLVDQENRRNRIRAPKQNVWVDETARIPLAAMIFETYQRYEKIDVRTENCLYAAGALHGIKGVHCDLSVDEYLRQGFTEMDPARAGSADLVYIFNWALDDKTAVRQFKAVHAYIPKVEQNGLSTRPSSASARS